MKPIVWTIAGSDSSAGAGIQADLHTFQQFEVHGASVITAITAQNTHQIKQIYYVSQEHINAQLSALQDELPAIAIKIGMLGHVVNIECIIQFLTNYSGFVVLDPVLIATSGRPLFFDHINKYVQRFTLLLPYIYLLTPNIAEAEILTGKKILCYQDIKEAANIILAYGVKNVLIKGGHFTDNDFSQDYWTNGSESCWLSSHRYPPKNYRGTGCIFSSAIAASLALGYNLKDALVIAKMYINQGIRLHQTTPYTALPAHAGWPENEMDLPCVSNDPVKKLSLFFPDCGTTSLGLYPIVDSVEWVKKLLPIGVKTIQLRLKNKDGILLENEIKQSISLAKQYNARLFINDYWEYAIDLGAYGVHLGQEDLKTADMEKICQAGLRVGISTHCYYEVARAHFYKPSYIACGPIFATTSKVMYFAPQGIAKLKRWQRTLGTYRLVAIGGIDEEKMVEVLATGIDGVAMISAITKAKDSITTTQLLLKQVGIYLC